MLKTERILLIENNPEDATNILGTIKALNNLYKWHHSKTTEEALQYLQSKTILPQLIIFGLEQDEQNSIEFLKTIKSDNKLKKIPIVMISSSENNTHVLESFHYGVAGYMVKTNDLSELKNLIDTIMRYWNMCELPH